MINFLQFLFLVSCTILLQSCSEKKYEQGLMLVGEINANFYTKIQNNNHLKRKLTINSTGGSPQIAQKVALNIILNKNDLWVSGVCISVCAERILPAANTITMINEPIIGYHWNSAMNFYMLEQHGGDLSKCDFTEVQNEKNLYKMKNLNVNFWHETLKRLDLESYQVIDKPYECPWKIRTFKNYLWLPTSQQLKHTLGLKFQGNVCADNSECFIRKINYRWKAGTRIVVGDKVIVSKGRTP